MNGESISGESECKSAAAKLGISFGGTETESGFPKRCYVLIDPRVSVAWWNEHSVGATEFNSSPICKVIGKINFYLIINYLIAQINLIVLLNLILKFYTSDLDKDDTTDQEEHNEVDVDNQSVNPIDEGNIQTIKILRCPYTIVFL